MTPEEQAAADAAKAEAGKADAAKAAADKAEADRKAAEGAGSTRSPETMTAEQVEALKSSGARWDAVRGFFVEKENGTLELNPNALPPEVRRRREEPEDPDEAARARDRAAEDARLAASISGATGAMADKIAKDFQVQRSIEDELKGEPGGELILKHAKAVMDRVPVERRTEAAWRNAVKLGRGETEPQRRKMWEDEGSKRGAEELRRAHNIAIPRGGPAPKTDAEMVADLSPAQLREAERKGIKPEAYAKRLNELGLGGRR